MRSIFQEDSPIGESRTPFAALIILIGISAVAVGMQVCGTKEDRKLTTLREGKRTNKRVGGRALQEEGSMRGKSIGGEIAETSDRVIERLG